MKQRILTALLLAPLVLVAFLVRSPYPLFCLCLLVATLGFWELRTLAGVPRCLPVLTLIGIALPFFGTEIQSNRDPNQIILYACALWLVGLYFANRCSIRSSTSAEVDLAGLWISMPMTCLLMLHKEPLLHRTLLEGAFVLLILLPIWAGDVAGYFVGKKFGSHLMAPRISPKKTWEGAVANFLLCVATAGLLTPFIDPDHLWINLGVGASIGVCGQVGDLFESRIKRRSKVKHSGSLLPGHGGVLDRIDSLLFATPVASLILLFAFSA